jgi:hypothetical protein
MYESMDTKYTTYTIFITSYITLPITVYIHVPIYRKKSTIILIPTTITITKCNSGSSPDQTNHIIL